MNKIDYRYGNNLDLDPVTELYRASTLGEPRPVDNRATMKNMLEHANLVVTAWDGELMVGIARMLTDFAYVGYLAISLCARRISGAASVLNSFIKPARVWGQEACWCYSLHPKPSTITRRSGSPNTAAPGP